MQKNNNFLKTTTNLNIKMSAKGAKLLLLACQGEGSPIGPTSVTPLRITVLHQDSEPGSCAV